MYFEYYIYLSFETWNHQGFNRINPNTYIELCSNTCRAYDNGQSLYIFPPN